MPLIKWDSSLVLDLEPIDSHHKYLVSLLNKAQKSFLKGGKKGEISLVLDELNEYANYHFAVEEELMRKHMYQDTESHQQEHNFFRSWVLNLRDKHEQDDLDAYMEVTNVLIEWLRSHIMNVDKKCFFSIKEIDY